MNQSVRNVLKDHSSIHEIMTGMTGITQQTAIQYREMRSIETVRLASSEFLRFPLCMARPRGLPLISASYLRVDNIPE